MTSLVSIAPVARIYGGSADIAHAQANGRAALAAARSRAVMNTVIRSRANARYERSAVTALRSPGAVGGRSRQRTATARRAGRARGRRGKLAAAEVQTS